MLTILVVLAAVGVSVYMRAHFILEWDKKIELLAQNECQLLPGPVGAEDCASLDGGHILLFTSDHRASLWNAALGAGNTDQGKIFSLYTDEDGNIQTAPVPLLEFPSMIDFHPHGLHLLDSEERNLLFTINHGYQRGGERVEVFEVIRDSSQHPGVRLQYLYSIGSELFTREAMGVLNDLYVTKEGEFYVTQHLPFADHPHGRRGTGWGHRVYSFVQSTANELAYLLSAPLASLRRCHYNAEDQSTDRNVTCEVVARGTSYNGVQANADESVLFISDTAEHEVHAYKMDNTANSLELLRVIYLSHSADNIILEKPSDVLFFGAVPSIADHLKRKANRQQGTYCPGGAMQMYFDADSTSYTFRDLIIHDGAQLSSISVACPFQSTVDGTTERKVAFGSWEDEGILVCPRPK